MVSLPPRDSHDSHDSVDLGIDTAAEDASLALFATTRDEPVAVHRFRPESTMSRELVGEIATLLATAGVDRRAIGRIAVTTGPGQYGPLRTGIAVAQGMAMALDAPLAGIPRFQADAALVPPDLGRSIVAVHRTRTALAWAVFEPGTDGIPRERGAALLSTDAEAARDAPRPATWTGEVDDALDRARDAEGRSGDTVLAVPEMPRAVAIVRIARALGAFGDPASVDAVYLRSPSITKPREH